MSGMKTIGGIIGIVGGGLSLLYYLGVYRPAHTISYDPQGEPVTLISKLGNVIHMDEAKRIKVTYTTTSRPELNWASSWYPLNKLDKLFWAIDVRYPMTGTVPEKTVNKLLKDRSREAVDLAKGL